MLHRNRTRGSFHTRDELCWERRRVSAEWSYCERIKSDEWNK